LSSKEKLEQENQRKELETPCSLLPTSKCDKRKEEKTTITIEKKERGLTGTS